MGPGKPGPSQSKFMTAIIIIFIVLFLMFLWLGAITNATRKQWTIIGDYEKWMAEEQAARQRADALVKELYRANEQLHGELASEWENQTTLREDPARCEVEKAFYYEEVRRLYAKYEV
jgi:hypothetical protein